VPVYQGWKISYFQKYQNIENIKKIDRDICDIFKKMKICNKL